MRVCILEWMCGGGLRLADQSLLAPSLMDEGWAMLCCLCQQFTSGGHSVSTIVDDRALSNQQLNQLSTVSRTLIYLQSCLKDSGSSYDLQKDPIGREMTNCEFPNASFESLIFVWKKLALRSDLTIIVAPELDGTLQACIGDLCKAGIRLINCNGQLLQASCDKWWTAKRLHQHGIAHPMTWKQDDFSMDFLSIADYWCSKPRFGAGCEGLRKYTADQIYQYVSQGLVGSNQIIQAWQKGRPFSCSAVVDFGGKVTWLPLVTQEFQYSSKCSQYEVLQYQAARFVSPELQLIRPTELLNSSIRALSADFSSEARGWISVDLVLDELGTWTVIEVNSRVTTSVLELCQQGGVKLAPLMLGGYNGN